MSAKGQRVIHLMDEVKSIYSPFFQLQPSHMKFTTIIDLTSIRRIIPLHRSHSVKSIGKDYEMKTPERYKRVPLQRQKTIRLTNNHNY